MLTLKENIPGKGIYLGEQNTLNGTFDIFADPVDLAHMGGFTLEIPDGRKVTISQQEADCYLSQALENFFI